MDFKLHEYIYRAQEPKILESLDQVPVTVLLGARQCGKSTLVQHLLKNAADSIYLDMERPSHRRRLEDPELFLSQQAGKLVCLDEIQQVPEIFPVLRSLVDDVSLNIRFLLLGSASPDLLKQTSETLAGRIRYIYLTPFIWSEVQHVKTAENPPFLTHWRRGGFPGSFLSKTEDISVQWREQFIRTFLERDIPLSTGISYSETFSRLWRMCAHLHGQLLNSSRLGESLGMSHVTTRNWIGALESTFMLRLLPPFHENLKKRLVKTPKIYFRDSGILHSLLDIETQDSLLGHPVVGASWEGWCIEQITAMHPRWKASFYRDSNGQEIDLILDRGKHRIAFEFKMSLSPELSRGSMAAIELLKPEQTYLVCPMNENGYSISKNIHVCGISEMLLTLIKSFD